ncbi:MAG: Na(+)/H(+) antiporter subunit D [Syntrophobacterales bacterium RBG_19FT_COMBO_59_10]|nr:MAG: Na(+)/H(+) antiporter subunit D [Syntrophobacterales bacterium RBG_19FT_COMBO_59_10]
MPIDATFPPALVMLAGALLLPLLPRNSRSFFSLFVPLLALGLVWMAPSGVHLTLELMDYPLVVYKVDRLSRFFGTIFALITMIGSLFAFHVKKAAKQTAALLYAAGALGVTFAGDLITLFVFWELMSLPSTYLIWARGGRESEKAGMRYLMFHLFGGGLLFAGILVHTGETGRILIEQLTARDSLSSWLILAGVAVNAAVVPLHAWLPDAYPKATVTGAVFLSALTTKTAVYVLLRIFPGWEVLIYLGVLMALYGVVFAFLANDIREILAYHIISQVGYMVAGAGIGTEMAVNGASAHAFSHILYKALLFMGAGAVLHTTGKSKLTELGGLAQKQPLILWLYMIGAFSISGFPLFNGFISKSMVVAAAGEAHHSVVMFLLLLASVGTFLSVGLKLPCGAWYGENRGLSPLPPPRNMYLGMAAAAFFCILHGVAPGLLYGMLPYSVHFAPYTFSHVVETSQILIFTFAAFWVIRKQLAGEAGITLDVDWFYRRPARWVQKIFLEDLEAAFTKVETLSMDLVGKLSLLSKNPMLIFTKSGGKYFSPDTYRPGIRTLLLLVLFTFVLISFWGLLGHLFAVIK